LLDPAWIEWRSAEECGIDLAALADFLSRAGRLAVVDLETTGFAEDPASELLEVGIVLLEPGEERVGLARTLVRPQAPLPRAIQRLTGLCDADVSAAPPVRRVAQAVAPLLEGRVLIAHNASFERRFLTRFVAPSFAEATYLDSVDLLALTHPDAHDLRLESFTRLLLGTEEQHRALDDALDTLRILCRVAQGSRANQRRYLVARRAVERFAPDSLWLGLLGKDLAALDGDDPFAYIEIEASEEARVPFDEEAIASVLADEERGRRYFPGYRARQEQIDLARHFARHLDDGGVLLLEGGTGVGKSLAYLAAAIPFIAERGAAGASDPLVVSTRTKLLQDQLLDKDIAAAARFLGYPELRALSIKGRANYVCERRLSDVLAEGRDLSIFEEDRLAYAVLMACARTRPHGEIGSLPGALLRRYPPLRDLLRRAVAARPEQCSREQCARNRDCPFGKRRAALQNSQLIVANHDLLLRWPPDYPAFRHSIVDEGHELAGVADEAYALTVRPEVIFERIDELFGTGPRSTGQPLLRGKARRAALQDVKAWRRALHLDLVSLARALSDRASEYGEIQLPPYASRIFPEAAKLADTAAGRLEQIARAALEVEEQLEEESTESTPGERAETTAVGMSVAELRSAAKGLHLAFDDDGDESVAAFERLEAPFERWSLAIRQVSPATSFHGEFLQHLDSFAVVSASLFIGDDPFAAIGELEIEERAETPVARVSVESPFDYQSHMRVVALKNGDDLVEDCAAAIATLARELGGRTLGLFTSLRRMHAVAEILDQELKGEGFEILAPRRASDDAGALVQRFCDAQGGAVLLGARTFWQGLDIPGRDLQAVVIEKLPFEVPTELRKRREARIRAAGGDPFQRFALGKMLLYLKQMSGRLIRSERDRGLVVIVEARTDKRYFQQLRRAFPAGVQVRVGRRSAIASLLAEVGLGSSGTPPARNESDPPQYRADG